MDENSTREKRESMTQSIDIRTQTRHLSSLGHNDAQYTPFLPVRFVSSIHLYFKVKTVFFCFVFKSLRWEQVTLLCYPLAEHSTKSGKEYFPQFKYLLFLGHQCHCRGVSRKGGQGCEVTSEAALPPRRHACI